MDDCADQWFKIDELHLSASFYSDLNSLRFDSNSFYSDYEDCSVLLLGDSSLEEE